MITREPAAATSTAHRQVPGDEPVRVLHVVPAFFSGGMEHSLLKLVADDSSSVSHAIAVLQGADPELIAQARGSAEVHVLGATGRPNRFAWRQLRRLIRGSRPNIVHARSTGAWFDAAAATFATKTQLLLGFHGLTCLERPGRCRRLMNAWAGRRADAVLTVCHDAARMLANEYGVPAAKLRVIANGVDTDRFHPSGQDERADLRVSLGLPPTGLMVICAANLVPIKAIDVLLHAWRGVLRRGVRNASLLLVGDGPERARLQMLAADLRLTSHVRFFGSRGDVPELLRMSDLFVLPSRYECCSNAILEAMASGLPVVACKVGGTPELIETGKTGWLVPPERPELLADPITAATNDSDARRRIGSAARERAVSGFSLATWREQYVALYRELARRETQPASVIECPGDPRWSAQRRVACAE